MLVHSTDAKFVQSSQRLELRVYPENNKVVDLVTEHAKFFLAFIHSANFHFATGFNMSYVYGCMH